MMTRGEQPEAKHFTHHADVKISELSVDILSTEHTASKIWEKHSAHIETEEMVLKLAVPKAINAYKTKVVETVKKKLLEELSLCYGNKDIEGQQRVTTQIKVIDDLKNKLSKELDRVVL